MVHRIVSKSLTEFYKTMEQESVKSARLLVLFTGSKSASTGKSWCPDCVRAEPLIDEIIENTTDDTTLVTVYVDREPYRQPNYQLRTDPAVTLRCVPTLLNWKSKDRLNDSQCQNKSALLEFLC
jgi:thiol-disulfide isomerase/thioredoxin